jgi:hypothetical protein
VDGLGAFEVTSSKTALSVGGCTEFLSGVLSCRFCVVLLYVRIQFHWSVLRLTVVIPNVRKIQDGGLGFEVRPILPFHLILN